MPPDIAEALGPKAATLVYFLILIVLLWCVWVPWECPNCGKQNLTPLWMEMMKWCDHDPDTH